MSHPKNARFSEGLFRLSIDYLAVHCCMIASLMIPVAVESLSAVGAPDIRLREAVSYYRTFCVLSPLFPLIFYVSGLYTQSRAYLNRHKLAVAFRAAMSAALVLAAVNYIAFRNDMPPRSSMVLFALFVSLLIPGLRAAKAFLIGSAESRELASEEIGTEEKVVLVVGGAGYIGSALVRKLIEAGRKVRVLDKLVYGDGPLQGVLGHPNLELKVGDCRNIQDVVGAVRGADAVIHLAAIVGDPACEQDHKTALEINYAATRMLVEVAKGHGVSRLIFASSCSVYGATDIIMDENSAVHPISLYGQTKVDSELALLAAQTTTFHPTILRLATVFGLSYRPRFDLVVNLLTAKAYKEALITIFNGQQWRPFIHVKDVAAGFVKVLESPIERVSGQIFNLGDDRLNCTLTEVAEKILRFFPGTRVDHIENSDRRNYRVSFEKIRSRLGFRCSLDLDAGIQQIVTAFECGEIVDYTDIQYNNQKFLMISGSPTNKSELDSQVMAAFSHPMPQTQSAELLTDAVVA